MAHSTWIDVLGKKDHEVAFTYLQKAYTKDPKYFGPRGLVLMPDMLQKIRKYDEAVEWCDKILTDSRRRRDVKEVLKKNEAGSYRKKLKMVI